MMEAAIKNGINYIGFDVSEKAVQTCIERCKLTFTTTEELYASFGVENEVELKETVKTYLQEVSNERKTSYVESLNIREASNYSQEKVDKVVAALKTK